jgi:hypothetical protein
MWRRRSLLEALVRSGFMVVIHELAKDVVQVAAAKDQMMVEELAACRANPPLGECVGSGRAIRQADHSHPFVFEDLVEGEWELGVPVMEQDPRGQLAVL